MSVRTPCPDDGRLRGLLDGTPPPEEQAELTAHLDDCAGCQTRLVEQAAGGLAWQGPARALARAEPPGAGAAVLPDHARLERRRRAPSRVPGLAGTRR